MTAAISPARFGRGRIVALQTAAGCGAAAAAAGGAFGYALGGAGVTVAVLSLLRWRGSWADARLVRRLHRGAFTGGPEGATGDAAGLGLAGTLVPALEVTATADRNGPPVGVLCDGRGFAAVLELPPGTVPSLPVGLLSRWLAEDPSRPAVVQLLVERHGLPPWDFQRRFLPTLAYRQLPALHAAPAPVAVRSWLVLRYEPWDAPEAAARRGGGVLGARRAVTAAAARLRTRLAARGVAAGVLGAPAVRSLLRQLGDVTGEGQSLPGSWAEGLTIHCCLSADIASQEDWSLLMAAVAGSPVDRAVVAATVSRAGEDTEVRTAVRLVSAAGRRAAEERDRLADGLRAARGPIAHAMGGDQAPGILATLPLACPARSLVEATGFSAGTEER